MILRKLPGALIALFLSTSPVWAALQPLKESLPMIGTDANGHAYPGATLPFGMVQLSPDTGTEGWGLCSGYRYSDSMIEGFSHTHLSGTGCGCLGDVLLMPVVGEVHLNAGSPGNGYASRFNHSKEEAIPGYYRVFLDTPGVSAELTATERCGFHKYTFPASEQSHVILDLAHGIGNGPIETALNVENENTVSGYRISDGWGGKRAIYFVMQFSKPFGSFGVEQGGKQLSAGTREAKAKEVKAFFNYKTSAGDVIMVKVGISGTGIDGARKNLEAEIPKWDFDGVRKAASKQWKDVFSAVEIKTFDPHVEKTFYANLYLTCIAPALFNDVDGTYRGYDHQNHPQAHFQNYSTLSIWDIYRAEWPLLTILQPRRVDDMVQTMLAEYHELGQHTTPIWPLWGNETWCMIGYHSADMISEAYLEGYRGFDGEEAYQAMRDTAMQDRNGLDTYKKLGYVASAPGKAATSCTLEYTIDDWCLAKMAETLGHSEDAKLFYQRAGNYRNLFDQSTKFFRGRKADGKWRMPFTDRGLVGDEYTEADAWQYAFSVQHDVPGMISLYGGDQGFIEKMDTMFTTDSRINTSIPDISGLIGQDSQGDEQCHHVPYLYDYAGAPYETQKRVRQIMATLYGDTPAGQCGNVDCGQMSAWYIFSALGIYPVEPASGVLAIGSPAVSKAVIHLDREKFHGRTFTVVAENNSARNVYIQSATLNGKPLSHPWINRSDLIAGGTLHFVMGPKPNPQWGSAPGERPPATMPAGFEYAQLPEPAGTDEAPKYALPIRIACGSDGSVGGFISDPDVVDASVNHADSPVDTTASGAAPADVYKNERYGKDFTYTFPVPEGQGYLVRLHFAEIFDDGAGRRLENIFINRRAVLTNFDIYSAAGGMNKALVKEFPNVRPNRQGNISIRVTSTADSPDQNAKISAIEIVKENSTAAADKPFIIKSEDGQATIAIDTSDAPELTDWAEHKLAPTLAGWYPKITTMLSSPGFSAPDHVQVSIKPVDGVASTSGDHVMAGEDWCNKEMNGQAVGSLVHELVHVVQQYHHHTPGWVTEGLADYVRWFKYEPQSHGADLVWMRKHEANKSPRYDEGYRVTANFFNWLAEKYDSNIIVQLNTAARDGNYNADFWKQHTGKSVEELGGEWKENIHTRLSQLLSAGGAQ